MVSSVTTNTLSTVFANQVNVIMSYERQPLTDLTTKRDSVTLQGNVYTDMNGKLKDLQTAVEALTSTDAFTAMSIGRSVSVSPSTANTTVATATASSCAIAGDYTLSVTNLAQAQSKASALLVSGVDVALGKKGTLLLGSDGTVPGATVVPNSVISDATSTTTPIANGIQELGSGTYTIETRLASDGVTQQFRLKNADGTAMAIQDQTQIGTSAMTDSWQNIPTTGDGVLDTGRGLSLTFSGQVGDPATVNYNAKGVQVNILETDTLTDIANKINSATQPDGHDMKATIIGNQLVFTANQTGTAHEMFFQDGTHNKDATTGTNGLGFSSTELQPALNAEIYVNNLKLTPSSNSNLTGIISGVTLNLAADATGNQAVIHVNQDVSTVHTAVQAFVDQLNSVQTYIQAKTGVTDNGDQTYTRGALADDNIFSDLRSNMYDMVMTPGTNSGIYKSLSDLGITIDDNLKVSISDSSKLDKALTNNFGDVTALLDQVMGNFDNTLKNFTGDGGYVTTQVNSINSDVADLNAQVTTMNAELTARQQQLVDQYGAMQAALTLMTYNANTWATVYNGSLNLTSSSSTTSTSA